MGAWQSGKSGRLRSGVLGTGHPPRRLRNMSSATEIVFVVEEAPEDEIIAA
jgi:hypothetical protein